jgi:hypothetical protein
MKPYRINDVNLTTGTVVKCEVDSAWLHRELLASADRLLVGMADNLDAYDAIHNPTGAFVHQDVQEAFYGLTGAPRQYKSVTDKRLAVLSAANALMKNYA